MKFHHPIKDYFNQWHSVKLSQFARTRLEHNLIEYAHSHSRPDSMPIGPDGRPAYTPYVVKFAREMASRVKRALGKR